MKAFSGVLLEDCMEGHICEVMDNMRARKHDGNPHQLECGEEDWLAREKLGWLGVQV